MAKDNLGTGPAVWAAVALLVDYMLNVAVGIAAGIGVVVSAFPALHAYTLTLCLLVLLTLTLINLRGVRETGITFVVPVLVFVGCIAAVIVIALDLSAHSRFRGPDEERQAGPATGGNHF